MSSVTGYVHVQGGSVPGGHNVLIDGIRKPFITNMRECNAVALRHSDVVVDIGAYVGTFAIRCARFPVKRVVAYEPTPETYNVLSITKLPNLETRQMAVVGDDSESVELHLSKGIGVTNSIVLSRRKEESVTVPAISYANAVREASIVKIDVEGAEYGYQIVQPSLRALIIDFHPVPDIDWKAAAHETMQDIRDAGFTPVIEPTFESGWNVGGCWVRERETSGEYAPMIEGRECCGCGTAISTDGRGLCRSCWDVWRPNHRKGYRMDVTRHEKP